MISLCPKGLLCFLSPTLAVFFSEAEEESSSSGMSGFDKDDSPKPIEFEVTKMDIKKEMAVSQKGVGQEILVVS